MADEDGVAAVAADVLLPVLAAPDVLLPALAVPDGLEGDDGLDVDELVESNLTAVVAAPVEVAPETGR